MKAKVLSAGVVIIRSVRGEPHFLLLRAYANWDFPKGLVEPGEDPLQAAIREVEEETTLTALEFAWGHDYRETPPYGHGKVARYYLARSPEGDVSLPVSPELGRPEHNEFRWAPYVEAHKLVALRLHPVLDWAYGLIVHGTSPH